MEIVARNDSQKPFFRVDELSPPNPNQKSLSFLSPPSSDHLAFASLPKLGASVLFGASRGQGALRQLGGRALPRAPTAAAAAAARLGGALLPRTVRGGEARAASLLSATQT